MIENDTYEMTLRQLNEELSVSVDVQRAANKLSEKIQADCAGQKSQNVNGESIKTDTFIFDLFGSEYAVVYTVYTDKCNHDYYGITNVRNQTITLNLHYVDGQPDTQAFDDIIYHELLHVFQYIKNKKDYLDNPIFSKQYRLLFAILNNQKFSDEIKTFASALYVCYDFEQDAMVHGLYGYLKDKNFSELKTAFLQSDQYAYLNDIAYALKHIDLYDEALFGIKTEKVRDILEINYKRYMKKLSHVLQKSMDDHEIDGLIHIPHHSRNK